MKDETCAECGSSLENVNECRDYLNEMIKWDFEDFTGVGKVHHLTVLSYNLQHPSVYSPMGLDDAKNSLQEFLTNPEAFSSHDERNRKLLASDVRDWKIVGTPENYAKYVGTPLWKMNASIVVEGGLPLYVENVKKWARSVFESLVESGDLPVR